MTGYKQKSSRNAQKAVVFFVIFMVVYLCSQLWDFSNTKLRCEQVIDDTIYDFVSAEGIAFRDEAMIPQAAQGITVYNYSDGEEVAKNQAVAAVYQDQKVSTIDSRLEQSKRELNSLEKAQTAKATRYFTVTNLSGQINDQAGKIVDFVSDGVVEGIADQRETLTSLMNRKKIALGEENTFAERITQLKSEVNYLEQEKAKITGTPIPAPSAGYFCQNTDGYETILTQQALKEMTYDSFQTLKAAEPSSTENFAGKIVKTHIWNMAVELSKEQAEKFEEGDRVKLDFKFASGQTISARTVKIIPDSRQENFIVIFECKDVTDELLKVRRQDVDIIFTTYSGFRINSNVLHHENGKPGVYVLDKTTIRFKPVEIVKDNGNFILCSTPKGIDEEHELHLLDLVVTESDGVELKDGAILDEHTVKGVESNHAGT